MVLCTYCTAYACSSGKHGHHLLFISAILMLLLSFHIISRLQYHIQPQVQKAIKNERICRFKLHREEINQKLPDECIMQHHWKRAFVCVCTHMLCTQ